MSPRVLLRLGLRSLLLHKLRSALSILGVVFGVAAVTAMSSVGEGARRESIAQIGALGIDTVILRARAAHRRRAPSRPASTCARWSRSARVVPGLRAVAPVRVATARRGRGQTAIWRRWWWGRRPPIATRRV